MRIVQSVLMLSVPATVSAHELPGSESVQSQLAHQFLSLHHAPWLALAIVAGLVLARALNGYLEKQRR